jgi:hypothetical protein
MRRWRSISRLQAVDVTRRHHRDDQRGDERHRAHGEQPRAHLPIQQIDFLLMACVGDVLQRGQLIEDLQNGVAFRHDSAAEQGGGFVRCLCLLAERHIARGPVITKLGLQPCPVIAFVLRRDGRHIAGQQLLHFVAEARQFSAIGLAPRGRAVNQRVAQVNRPKQHVRADLRERLLTAHIRLVNGGDALLNGAQAAHELIAPQQPQCEDDREARQQCAANARAHPPIVLHDR